VGLIPAGTSNSAARELGIPLDIEGAVRVAATGRPRALDLGFFRSIGDSPEPGAAPAAKPGIPPGARLFFLCASAGPDAEIVRTLHRERHGPTSRLAYVLHGARCFFRYAFGRIRVASDGRPLAGGVSMAVASNMSQYGGPLRITPEARADDGLLDLCALRPGSRLTYLGLLWAAFRGGVTGCSDAETVRARSVRLEPEDPRRPVPFQADGEPAGYLPVELGILPAAQEFLVSAEAAAARRGPL
jgi:diacylglycerol kinase (ATP)